VTICEAYLAYLHSGNHDDYWRVLWDNGRITKEHLEGLNIPIKGEGLLHCYDLCYIVIICVTLLLYWCCASMGGTAVASQRSTWRDSSSPSRVRDCYIVMKYVTLLHWGCRHIGVLPERGGRQRPHHKGAPGGAQHSYQGEGLLHCYNTCYIVDLI
jgi:hypothetical protein